MADLRWIKVATDIFSNRKIRLIETEQHGYEYIILWFKLLCLAGNINDGGQIYVTKRVPYSESSLSVEFGMPVGIVHAALQCFLTYNMIDISKGFISIVNWEKYQSLETYEKKKEQARIRQANKRDRERDRERDAESVTERDSHGVTVTQCNAGEKNRIEEKRIEENRTDTSLPQGGSRDDDTDGETEEPSDDRSCPFAKIAEMYHRLCPSFPAIKQIDGNRRKAVAARWRVSPSLDTFAELFTLAESSSFLKGNNDRNWSADFDWMMKPTNFTKILEHKYDDKASVTAPQEDPKGSFDTDELFSAALKRSYGYDPREKGISYGTDAGGEE